VILGHIVSGREKDRGGNAGKAIMIASVVVIILDVLVAPLPWFPEMY
jgi:hypothetical protein